MSFSSRMLKRPDLDARLQVGKFVDRKDAPVAPRDDAEVNRPFMSVMETLRCGLDRIDVADQVGDRDVGRRKLFAVPLTPVDPLDGRRVAAALTMIQAELAHRRRTGCR